MKVFVSSLIRGMVPMRAAAREAIASLGHEAIMAEDFLALPQSPQVACLDGVRAADEVVLLLGASYGAKQAPSVSASHEEFLEANDRRAVFAFIQRGVQPDVAQAAFVAEVRGWVGGYFSPEFDEPGDLRNAMTKAIHHWPLSTASAPLDPAEVLKRALAAFPSESNRGSSGPLLQVVVAGGPGQVGTMLYLVPAESKPPRRLTLYLDVPFHELLIRGGDRRLAVNGHQLLASCRPIPTVVRQ
jgi:hypothetical protein